MREGLGVYANEFETRKEQEGETNMVPYACASAGSILVACSDSDSDREREREGESKNRTRCRAIIARNQSGTLNLPLVCSWTHTSRLKQCFLNVLVHDSSCTEGLLHTNPCKGVEGGRMGGREGRRGALHRKEGRDGWRMFHQWNGVHCE